MAMWPFTKKPKRTGFIDSDGTYKVKLDRNKFRRNAELNMPLMMLLDQQAKDNGRPDLANHVEKMKKLIGYAEREEPVPAEWLDPTIGTIRADSHGQPARYPASENRG